MILFFIIIHAIISIIFFVVGFLMRYGLCNKLVVYSYQNLPYLSNEEYDEFKVRRFVGETTIKLGSCMFLIASIGIIHPKNFLIAVILGWICFFIIAVGSVSFMDNFNLIKKIKRIKETSEEARRIDEEKSKQTQDNIHTEVGIIENIETEEVNERKP